MTHYASCTENDAAEGRLEYSQGGEFSDLGGKDWIPYPSLLETIVDDLTRVNRHQPDDDDSPVFKEFGIVQDHIVQSSQYLEGQRASVAPTDAVPEKQYLQRLPRYPWKGVVDGVLAVDVTPTSVSGHYDDLAALMNQYLSWFNLQDGQQAERSPPRLYLPILIINHNVDKKESLEFLKNSQRLSTVSAVRFLASLRIMDWPVFGLVTDGHEGYLSATWYSTESSVCNPIYPHCKHHTEKCIIW